MSMTCSVMVVDDEEVIRLAATQALSLAGFSVFSCGSAEEAIKHVSESWPGIIVTDIKMPGISGLELMSQALKLDPQIPIILISGHADITIAVKAIKDGAYDFVEKPFSAGRLVDVVGRALDKRLLVLDNRNLRAELVQQQSVWRLLGRSKAIQEINQTLEYVATTDTDVLVHGETGTGKELVAETLHHFSDRKLNRFVAINCGAMPESLFESELFGHERGAYTSADKTHIGKLEYANKGTFFLDEIESMPIPLQIKLLRVLQERKIQRLGSNQDISLDLRIVAATKTDLLTASNNGEFREDLYYRLNVVTINIPPLRDRQEDIPILFQHFFDQANKRMNKEDNQPSSSFMAGLLRHDWPGNVRELQNFAERAAIGLGKDGPTANDSEAAHPNRQLNDRMESYEKLTIQRELIKNNGNITQTYETLGVSRKTLYDKMKKYGLSKDDFNDSR